MTPTFEPPRVRDRAISVLVVDDSAVVREVLQRILTDRGRMAVTVASDPIIAMHKMKRSRPDVILLDLAMPRMDGLSFLRMLMAQDPIPVVVCAASTGGATDTVLRALEEGAVDVVVKPRIAIRDFLEDSVTTLLEAIEGASRASVIRWRPRASGAIAPAADLATSRGAPSPDLNRGAIVAIGASTGGTDALGKILHALPEDSPGVVIVQHMPEGFTSAFARRLDQSSRLEVREAMMGDRVVRGRALIAPGNSHLRVLRSGDEYVVEVASGPLVSHHRPSVDVLFRSVASAAGSDAVGVLLTGMGDDGASGLWEMKQRGAATIAQDEATSVVFGMPKAAIMRGAADDIVPLPRIPAVLLDRASRRARRAQTT